MRRPLALLSSGFIAAVFYADNAFSVPSPSGGLPKDVVPHSYFIHLEPKIDERITEGVEAIEIEVLEPTKRIVLNASDTQIKEAKIESDDRSEDLTPQFDLNQQTVSFELTNALAPGKYRLSINFQSGISKEPKGLFIQDYADGTDNLLAKLLTTKSPSSDTRRIFPCWDEPTFQASFQISVKTRKQETVISNTPVLVEQPFGPEEHIVVFEKTSLMASKKVFLACGALEWLEDEVAGVKLRLVTTSGKKELGKYALSVTKQLLPYFTDYLGVPFLFSKLDQIAFPLEASDELTETNGPLLYDEQKVLTEVDTDDDSGNRKIFLAVAEKIALQWWSDPSTPQNDLWLKKGFASWMARKAAEHFNPEWKIWLHASDAKEAVMALEAGEMVRPLQPPLTGVQQAEDSSAEIMNQKSWLLLRMLEEFSGEERFRDGLRSYLARPPVSKATYEDLWTALEHVTGKPMRKIISAWTEQSGFPLIRITTQCVNGNRVISLEQVPFSQRRDSATLWSVPVGIRSTLSLSDVKYALLDKLSNNFDLTGCGGTLQANAGNLGYFRVLYEPALFNDLQKDIEKLPESDRLNLVTNTWALVESGHLPASSYFDLLERLHGDDSLAVWQSALGTEETTGALRLIDRLEQGRPGREAYQKYICSLFAPKFQKLGWEEKANENAETREYRAILIETLGFFGDRDVIDESFKRFENYHENRPSTGANLWSAIIAIVGRYSSQTVNRELLSMVSNARRASERRMFLRALGHTLGSRSSRRNPAIPMVCQHERR